MSILSLQSITVQGKHLFLTSIAFLIPFAKKYIKRHSLAYRVNIFTEISLIGDHGIFKGRDKPGELPGQSGKTDSDNSKVS